MFSTLFLLMTLSSGFKEAWSNFHWIFWENNGYFFMEYPWFSSHPVKVVNVITYHLYSLFIKTVLLLQTALGCSKATATVIVIAVLMVKFYYDLKAAKKAWKVILAVRIYLGMILAEAKRLIRLSYCKVKNAFKARPAAQ